MNNRGLISSRSDVIALLSGELLQLRIEKSLLFKTSFHWEPHYFLLTSIGILKFKSANMTAAPSFVPLKHMLKSELIEENSSVSSQGRTLRIIYEISDVSGEQHEMMLSSETPSQVIEWTTLICRLRSLYEESKGAIEATVGK